MNNVVKASLRRKIAFPLFILFLMLCYGAYLQLTFIDLNKTAQREWQNLRASITEREEGAKTLERVVKAVLESHPSADDEEGKKRDALEKSVAEVRDAAAKLAGAQSPSVAADADFNLSQKFGEFFAAVEPFQELRAAFNYRSALEDLASAQTNLTDARGRYNDAVSRRFPAPSSLRSFVSNPLNTSTRSTRRKKNDSQRKRRKNNARFQRFSPWDAINSSQSS